MGVLFFNSLVFVVDYLLSFSLVSAGFEWIRKARTVKVVVKVVRRNTAPVAAPPAPPFTHNSCWVPPFRGHGTTATTCEATVALIPDSRQPRPETQEQQDKQRLVGE